MLNSSGFNSQQGQGFLSYPKCPSWLSDPHIVLSIGQWGFFPPRVKRLGHESDRLPVTSTKGMNEWSSTSSHK